MKAYTSLFLIRTLRLSFKSRGITTTIQMNPLRLRCGQNQTLNNYRHRRKITVHTLQQNRRTFGRYCNRTEHSRIWPLPKTRIPFLPKCLQDVSYIFPTKDYNSHHVYPSREGERDGSLSHSLDQRSKSQGRRSAPNSTKNKNLTTAFFPNLP